MRSNCSWLFLLRQRAFNLMTCLPSLLNDAAKLLYLKRTGKLPALTPSYVCGITKETKGSFRVSKSPKLIETIVAHEYGPIDKRLRYLPWTLLYVILFSVLDAASQPASIWTQMLETLNSIRACANLRIVNCVHKWNIAASVSQISIVSVTIKRRISEIGMF